MMNHPAAPFGSGSIANALDSDPNYRGLGPGAGDRGPKGQNPRSDHKQGLAQDFHVDGFSDGAVFSFMVAHPTFLPSGSNVILHGTSSGVGPPHLHVGFDPSGTRYGGQIRFQVEGLAPSGSLGPNRFPVLFTEPRPW